MKAARSATTPAIQTAFAGTVVALAVIGARGMVLCLWFASATIRLMWRLTMTPESLKDLWELHLPELSVSREFLEVTGTERAVEIFDLWADRYVPNHFKRVLYHVDYKKEMATRRYKVSK